MPRGFEGVRKVAADVNARKNAGGSGQGSLWFRLPKSGDQGEVRFLEQGDDIFWAEMHEVPVEGRNWGDDVPCLDQDHEGIACPGCQADLPRRFKGYINLIWRDAPVFERDEKGKVVKKTTGQPVVVDTKDQVAIWSSGIRLFEELDEIDANFGGLTSRDFRVKRKGEGLDTKYSINPSNVDGGPQPLSDEDKELAENKYDLSAYTKPPTEEEFNKRLRGERGGSASNGSGEQAKAVNPFMRSR